MKHYSLTRVKLTHTCIVRPIKSTGPQTHNMQLVNTQYLH